MADDTNHRDAINMAAVSTVDKAVCTEESGAARLEAVLVALVERKARALHAEQARRRLRHPLLLLLRDHVPEVTSQLHAGCARLKAVLVALVERKARVLLLLLWTMCRMRRRRSWAVPASELDSPEALELERRRRRRRRRQRAAEAAQPRKHRTLLVSAIDEQAKVIHVLDPDELPRRARYTIMVTACLLLFLCLLLVGVTLRMAPLIDDMVKEYL
ncbi:hypothetical protein MSG28_002814 [Choristoneura fumiferana]|uniref:Uncharacterized protein n=1 Tax=Choristoneura fumiferana TaxID=7141 RepID=A0ACC0JJL3_CHOFU|nr:hypothetical protein MSG28_002814 [Choristoneura fumiferana]